jgi:hypothetical protein
MRLLISSCVALVAALPLAAREACAQAGSVPDAAWALARAADALPAKTAGIVKQRALMLALLSEHGRLLPSGLTAADLARIEAASLSEKSGPAPVASALDALPAADSIGFDGKKLAGGNFKNIDALVGADGRPVALDRQIPAFLVPLTAGDADALNVAAEAFQSGGEGELAARLDAVYGAPVAGRFVADGLAMRAYAGRIDDLYFHLAQEGGRGGAVDFYALTERLPYHPLTGLGEATPAAAFGMSDLLSGGAFAAVRDFLRANPGALARNPFAGFAARVMPYMDDAVRSAAAGSELKASREVVKLALADPRRFAPAPVPPLFKDRSRFLGGIFLSRFAPVSRKAKSEFSREIANVESETLLPDETGDPAGNVLLLDTRPEAVAPDPPDFDALTAGSQIADASPGLIPSGSDPAAAADAPAAGKLAAQTKLASAMVNDAHEEVVRRAQPAQEAAAASPAMVAEAQPVEKSEASPESAAPAAGSSVAEAAMKDQSIAREEPQPAAPAEAPPAAVRPASAFQVAVLVPTAAQAEAYANAIRESDERLSTNAAALNRALCYRKWLAGALAPIDAALAAGGLAPSAREQLERAAGIARATLTGVVEDGRRLNEERMSELAARGALRRDLEQQVRAERGEDLRRLAGTHV